MNYRHAFHAGNFADLVKHAALLSLLSRLTKDQAPLTVIDTHAGAGIYDITGVEAAKSGEAAAGIGRLMATSDAPAAFEPLKAAVANVNKDGSLRIYPGSPWLVAQAMRPGDRYVACELRPDEHKALAAALKGRPGVETLCADGYEMAAKRLPGRGAALVLIDPPFERPDDYRRCVQTTADLRRRNRDAVIVIWLPLKDLETFDAFLRDLEGAVRAPILVAETRMRPLSDPMKMNGCVLALVGAPDGLAVDLEPICAWVAQMLGDRGEGRVWRAD